MLQRSTGSNTSPLLPQTTTLTQRPLTGQQCIYICGAAHVGALQDSKHAPQSPCKPPPTPPLPPATAHSLAVHIFEVNAFFLTGRFSTNQIARQLYSEEMLSASPAMRQWADRCGQQHDKLLCRCNTNKGVVQLSGNARELQLAT